MVIEEYKDEGKGEGKSEGDEDKPVHSSRLLVKVKGKHPTK